MKKNKKVFILIVAIISISLLAAGTFAYWYWSNINDPKNLVISVGGINDSDIVYNAGNSHFVGNFQPTDSFCQSVNTTISFYKEERISNLDLDATIHMDINAIGENISLSDDVYWIVTSGNSEITCDAGYNGLSSNESVLMFNTFLDVQNGDVLNLLEDIAVTTTEQTFTIWIWIDPAGLSLDTLPGEPLDTNVWTEITMYSYQPNEPELDDGMIPVTIANDGTVTTIAKTDPDWYNYDDKEWANVVLVNENATEDIEGSQSRSYYLSNLSKNVEVNQSDILAYYVWIPRYKYKIDTNYECAALDNPTIEDNPECFAPYTVPDETREILINYYLTEYYGGWSDTWSNEEYEYGNNVIDKALKTGIFDYNFTADFDYEVLSVPILIDSVNSKVLEDGVFVPGDHGYVIDTELSYDYTEWKKEKSIDIQFEPKDFPMKKGDAVNTYYTHPAFWWDDDNDNYVDSNEMLSGIWVGKFETTPDKTSECYLSQNENDESCFIVSQNTTILPLSVPILFYINVANNLFLNDVFSMSQNFSKVGNIYGLNNDITNAHMMKNRDWGAVAYLSHSIYGINDEMSSCARWDCANIYSDGSSDYEQSTTGNITGIFDMADIYSEIVMGHYGSIIDSNDSINFSGMEELPERKYYDLYSETVFSGTSTTTEALASCTLETCGGHALNETAGWYGGDISFVNESIPWSVRGDSGMFTASIEGGDITGNEKYITWRTVLVPGFGP